ncbi:hypothetical protein MSG28_003398 [Choristoneura fumiferana]|uniref:Uncharacterized protein n=1 Tax=Choristoneura fumiferana TaxID=7141 RepID=A0ACC0KFB7_CHOFU|nr:hypothetical protein MSG28_003398 [Choristoneura fumiferana]
MAAGTAVAVDTPVETVADTAEVTDPATIEMVEIEMEDMGGGGGGYGGDRGGGGGDMVTQEDTIFIQGMDPSTSEDELCTHFGAIGMIKIDKKTQRPKVWMYKDKATGAPKGEATVTYEDSNAASSAIECPLRKDKILGVVAAAAAVAAVAVVSAVAAAVAVVAAAVGAGVAEAEAVAARPPETEKATGDARTLAAETRTFLGARHAIDATKRSQAVVETVAHLLAAVVAAVARPGAEAGAAAADAAAAAGAVAATAGETAAVTGVEIAAVTDAVMAAAVVVTATAVVP